MLFDCWLLHGEPRPTNLSLSDSGKLEQNVGRKTLYPVDRRRRQCRSALSNCGRRCGAFSKSSSRICLDKLSGALIRLCCYSSPKLFHFPASSPIDNSRLTKFETYTQFLPICNFRSFLNTPACSHKILCINRIRP